ncbi:MAG TPA: redoxin domain-containing protein [Pyrinomonadaceae bacterium]|jgi:peroxiredoxin
MEKKATSRVSLAAFGLILALMAVNLLLIRQNFALRHQLSEAGRKAEAPVALKAGETVNPIAGTDLNGRPFEVKYQKEGRRHLLLYFSPCCTYCVQQASLWREALNRIDDGRVSVVGVVSDREDRQAVLAHADRAGYFKTKTPMPIAFFDDASLARYKLTATPTTLLINEEGKVEHAWVAKWDEEQVSEAAAALK